MQFLLCSFSSTVFLISTMLFWVSDLVNMHKHLLLGCGYAQALILLVSFCCAVSQAQPSNRLDYAFLVFWDRWVEFL